MDVKAIHINALAKTHSQLWVADEMGISQAAVSAMINNRRDIYCLRDTSTGATISFVEYKTLR